MYPVGKRRKRTGWGLAAVLGMLLPLLLSSPVGAAGPYDLRISKSADRSADVALDGTTQSGNIYVFTSQSSTADITKVDFWLDNPAASGAPRRSEANPPYDFNGGNATAASPFNTTTLADGPHSITAKITHSNATTQTITADFTVVNGGSPPPPPSDAPDQIHLAWVGDPSTTMTVVWRTKDVSVPSTVEYRQKGDSTWLSASGALRSSGTTGTLHEVTLTPLNPSTVYEYRVQGPAATWSPVFETRTAPPAGHRDFSFVYVADTGLVGRTDGLATGTQQVLDEIVKLHPLFVLPGGDYIHYDTEKRFGTLDATIDVWFNQMQPLASSAPLMPTYGNHEARLGENFDSWAARFPTPTGFDSRRNYSFDVGDIHFVSVYATSGGNALPAATATWIDNDIAAARTAGARWVIPYFHVSTFADGLNHPSNLALRNQLAPIFERRDVKLVLMSHDQAYERSFPLVNASSTGYTRTSTALDCYTGADGVTWTTVSPGGLLSNQNSNFSQFKTTPPPSWTAVRDNTRHHFALLHVSAAGELRMQVYGVKGDGTPPVVQDDFKYTTGSCGTGLSFSPSSLALSAPAGGAPVQETLNLNTGDGSTASFTVSDDAGWLSVEPTSGSTPGTLTVTGDPTGLAAGTYTATITGSSPDYADATARVTFTVGTGSWAARASLPVSIRDGGGAALGGKVYYVAGRTSAARQRTLYAYDPATNTWATRASLPRGYPAVENPAVAAYDGELYAFGGKTGSSTGERTNAAVYTPSTNTWATLPAMPVARAGATAQAIGSKIYVVGGLDASGASLASVSVYDPVAKTWTSAAPMSTRRDGAASAVVGGRLFVFGGRIRNANGTTSNAALASAEAYDPGTDTWAPEASMPTGRRALVAGVAGGKVQLIGGTGSSGVALSIVEEYDPGSGAWSLRAPMPTPRYATVGGAVDEVVYVAGGRGSSSYLKKNEAFTP